MVCYLKGPLTVQHRFPEGNTSSPRDFFLTSGLWTVELPPGGAKEYILTGRATGIQEWLAAVQSTSRP